MQRISEPSQSSVLRLALACNYAEVPLASDAVHGFLSGQGWGENDVVDCELAVVEACNNAVKYSQGDSRQQPVRVEVECGSDQVEFRIIDHTPGFDWPKQIELPAPDSESGRGLYLIKSVMEYVHYFRSPNENTLVMRRRKGQHSS